MKTNESFNGWLGRYAQRLRQYLGDNVFYGIFVLLALLLFGDTLLPAIGHLLHVFIEIFESVIEHFIQSIFHVSPRNSEILTFWLGMAILSYLFWRVLRKAYVAMQKTYMASKRDWQAKPGAAKCVAVIRILLIFSALASTALMFT